MTFTRIAIHSLTPGIYTNLAITGRRSSSTLKLSQHSCHLHVTLMGSRYRSATELIWTMLPTGAELKLPRDVAAYKPTNSSGIFKIIRYWLWTFYCGGTSSIFTSKISIAEHRMENIDILICDTKKKKEYRSQNASCRNAGRANKRLCEFFHQYTLSDHN